MSKQFPLIVAVLSKKLCTEASDTEIKRELFEICLEGLLLYDNSQEPSSDEVTLTRNLPINISLTTFSKIIFNSRGQSVDSDYIFQNVLVSLQESGDTFDQGTLLGTGVFEYD